MSIFQPEKIEDNDVPTSNQKLLCLEGLIGAGKTTILEKLREKVDFYFITEPVLQWQKPVDSQSLLDNLYKDFDRWSYTFQVNSVLTRAQAIEQEKSLSRGRHLVMERSLLSDRECFARLYFDSGQMSPLEWYWYSRYYDFVNMNIKHPDAFIYLRVNPDVALNRIQKRKRKEEDTISVEYLHDLNRRYEALFAGGDIKNIRGETPVLVIDGNADMMEEPEQLDIMMNTIIDFLKEHNFKVIDKNIALSKDKSSSGMLEAHA